MMIAKDHKLMTGSAVITTVDQLSGGISLSGYQTSHVGPQRTGLVVVVVFSALHEIG